MIKWVVCFKIGESLISKSIFPVYIFRSKKGKTRPYFFYLENLGCDEVIVYLIDYMMDVMKTNKLEIER